MIYKINKKAVLLNICDSFLLVEVGIPNVLQRRAKQLNEEGAYIWNRIADGADTEEIVLELIDQYDAEPDQIRSDMDLFMKWLLRAGLIVTAEV